MRAIDGDRLKRKAQKVATEAWKMKIKASVETILNEFVDWIDDAPTIEPERKKGQWMVFETENERYDDIKCPFCKKTYTVDAYRIDDIGFIAEDFKFCPNCGSDMRGEQDDEQ